MESPFVLGQIEARLSAQLPETVGRFPTTYPNSISFHSHRCDGKNHFLPDNPACLLLLLRAIISISKKMSGLFDCGSGGSKTSPLEIGNGSLTGPNVESSNQYIDKSILLFK